EDARLHRRKLTPLAAWQTSDPVSAAMARRNGPRWSPSISQRLQLLRLPRPVPHPSQATPPMRACLLVVASGLFIASGSFADNKDDWSSLFNGKDLTGLKVHFKDADKDADPAKTFSVKDGALIVSGKPTCYIYTEKSYKDYVVTFEWRFPEGSAPDSNSG